MGALHAICPRGPRVRSVVTLNRMLQCLVCKAPTAKVLYNKRNASSGRGRCHNEWHTPNAAASNQMNVVTSGCGHPAGGSVAAERCTTPRSLSRIVMLCGRMCVCTPMPTPSALLHAPECHLACGAVASTPQHHSQPAAPITAAQPAPPPRAPAHLTGARQLP